MTEVRPATTAELLEHELDAVTGDTCGWNCDHHRGNFPGCQRAANHAGAQVITDVHVARHPGGALVTAIGACCDGAP